MDNVQELKEALPKREEQEEAASFLNLSKRERRELLIKESQKIFREKFMTAEEQQKILELATKPMPKTTSKGEAPPTFFLPDFVPLEKTPELTRLLTLLPEARRIQKELHAKYFPRKPREAVGEVKVKAADLQKFMDETWLSRPRAEKFLLRARGDLSEALELFVRSPLESDDSADDDLDWDLDLKLL